MTTTSTATDRHLDGITHPRARTFFLLDATLTGVNGLAYLTAAPLLADWFGPTTLLVRELGALLLVIAVGVAWLATRRPIPRRGAVILAEINALWVVASIGYAALGALTAVGVGWVLLQAALVGGFAAGQLWFARRG
jgi:hypothetical protein